MGDRRAPVQGEVMRDGKHHLVRDAEGRVRDIPDGTVSWEEHEEAWRACEEAVVAAAKKAKAVAQPGPSAERVAELGGFGYSELRKWLGRKPTTWRAR
jgi:hypothetical protein